MKKFAIAALVSVVAVPAFAQSVTLWGRFNTTVESVKTGSAERIVKVNSNSSRLGLKGVEDLGGGLKAAFQLEHGFDSDSGNSNAGNQFWGRASNVSLIGNFGEVRLGRWIPGSYFATVDYVSLHNHDTGTSADALASSATMFNPRSNKIGYFTPKLGNFSAEFDIHAGEGVDARAYDFSVNYDNGPVHYGFGYSKQGTQKQFAFRGLYQLGAFTFGGYYQRETEDTFKANPNRDIGRVSVAYTTGPSEFHLNVGGSKAGGSFGAFGGKQYTLGYNYNLSKRTKVYGYYTAIDRTAPNSVGDSSSLAAGLRHNF